MGRDKALLSRDGVSQLDYAFGLLQRVTERPFVSVRADQRSDEERGRFPQIVDRHDDLGPAAGILAAMHAYPAADWLVVACDLPNLDLPTLEFLLQHRSTGASFVAYRSSNDGLPEPLCAVYRSGSDVRIREFVDAGLKCPRKMMIESDTLLLDQPRPGALDNVNTPDELADSVLAAER